MNDKFDFGKLSDANPRSAIRDHLTESHNFIYSFEAASIQKNKDGALMSFKSKDTPGLVDSLPAAFLDWVDTLNGLDPEERFFCYEYRGYKFFYIIDRSSTCLLLYDTKVLLARNLSGHRVVENRPDSLIIEVNRR